MYLDLSGEWNIALEADEGRQSGTIMLPGSLQAAGYGNPITKNTPWVSALHDSYWYEQEEYKYAQENGVNVPFLAQPPRHFLGQAVYERNFTVPEESPEEWYFHVELARWRSQVWIDGEQRGVDCTLCGPHHIKLGRLAAGGHSLRVVMDNSLLYPYRPDAHGVSDALGATWNGMAGEIALYTEDVDKQRRTQRQEYAKAHKKKVEAGEGRFYIDGEPFYFRATHFGGEYPLTGYPSTDMAWWRRMMKIILEWGFNSIRFHSYCPPEAAFAAADEVGVYLLVECGMWNHFSEGEDGEEMLEVLRQESRRILENFGHHPSFTFFSPSNEPSGKWYQPLKSWVKEVRAYDEALGYGGRRIYTAQSGWPYEAPPAQIEGTDFVYFHRSGKWYRKGGMIRGTLGWKGKDYSEALEGARQPVVCHELGQFCAYPNFSVIDKFTGCLQPGNYKVFYENAKANGILPYADVFVKCSGENQLRLYKEDLEANLRTPQMQGFELLDLHDYLGQGTALVGILDAFWENKGYGSPERFRSFCADTVLLARCGSYVWKNTDKAEIPVEVCHYGKEEIRDGIIRWTLSCGEKALQSGRLTVGEIPKGGNTKAGSIKLLFQQICDAEHLTKNTELTLTLELSSSSIHEGAVRNSWDLYLFVKPMEEVQADEKGFLTGGGAASILYTRDWQEARCVLEKGGAVVFNPYLSDLNFECTALSGGSVGWNGQMGPRWCRTMGIVVEDEHPIFRHFPTKKWSGWQWEDILDHGRGFHMEGLEQITPIVQPIDDWNRNLLQGMIFEAKVLKGKLLVVCADLEGGFEERPGAYSLKQAIFKYAASEEFAPDAAADAVMIESKLFPMLRMGGLVKEVLYTDGRDKYGDENAADEDDIEVKDGMAIVEADPNTSVRVRIRAFPVLITIKLKKSIAMRGIVYVPEQRDRNHAGFVKDYVLEVRTGGDGGWETAVQGAFLNTCRSQSIMFDRAVCGDAVRLKVLSAYGCEDKYVWQETGKGWFRIFKPLEAVVQIAGLHIICDEDAPHGDVYTTGKEQKTKTAEIEL